MSKLTPLFAKAGTAASILDMTRPEFLKLVKQGVLPPPCNLDRWRVADLEKIMSGDAARQQGLEM